MKLPKVKELKEALKAIFKGPYTVKFPFEPSVPPERFRGKPEFDEKECVGCQACSQVCPARAIEVIDEIKNKGGKRRIEIHLDRCIFCGQCQVNCITEKGVRLTGKYDLATFNRKEARVKIEKELIYCDCCGEPITARDHLRWLVKKLGPYAYNNPLLMFTSQKDLCEVKEIPPIESPQQRADSFRILCPKCRRQTTIREL